jgi:hypothetical protein
MKYKRVKREDLYHDLINKKASIALKGDLLIFNIYNIRPCLSHIDDTFMISCNMRQLGDKRVSHSNALLLNNKMKDIFLLK